MPKLIMIYPNFLDRHGECRRVGGVETYLWNLAKLANELNWKPELVQLTTNPFDVKHDILRVIGIRLARWRNKRRLYHAAVRRVASHADVLLFGADHISVKTYYPRSISINHGIGWDLAARYQRSNPLLRNRLLGTLYKRLANRQYRHWFENAPNRVCVDYNMMNWYRTQVDRVEHLRYWVIPNFAAIPPRTLVDWKRHESDTIRVLFARRYVDYRGALIMAHVAARWLRVNTHGHFTFAGEGPCEAQMRSILHDVSDRVEFTKYDPDDTTAFHQRFHVAVVPSFASEGTSLSVAEAMASGCCVIATAVGGIPQMILNGYNGILVPPGHQDAIYEALSKVAADRLWRLALAQRAYDIAAVTYSLQRWKASWTEVLQEVAAQT